MAPDTDLLRDIGIVACGIVVFVLPIQSLLLQLVAYLLIGFGVAHMLFRINLDKTTGKRV